MADHTSPRSRTSSERHTEPEARRRRRGWQVLGIAVLALAGFQLISCRAPSTWQPYQRPTGELRAAVEADAKARDDGGAYASDGSCVSCHEGCRDPHPHGRQASCVHCHGGDPTTDEVRGGIVLAHPQPTFPKRWQGSGNPERPYTLTLEESQAWVKFVNPGDLRVANQTCGPCHAAETLQVMKSLMNTSQHFWGTVTYANGIVSTKRSILGESYGPDGKPQIVQHLVSQDGGVYDHESGEEPRRPTDEELAEHSWSPIAVPLPHWEVTQPSNIFRIFEKGSRLGTVALGLNGLNTPIPGLPDKFEDPGRPNNRSSDRGLGTLNRVDLPTLNVHKTRLNDPHLSFFGTNDQPGDFRSSGCTSCHMVYANDRDPVHSGPWAQYGHQGKGNVGPAAAWANNDKKGQPRAVDAQLKQDEPGHPVVHQFTRSIPSSNCMVCHMHQPNSFLNTYYGFQMWSYETDGEKMWPAEQHAKSASELYDILDRNPEGAAQRGKWGDREFLDRVAEDINPELEHTQFADYHGHGWIFRGVFKTDRKGNLLDKDGEVVDYARKDKFAGVIPELGSAPTAADINAGCFAPKPGQPVHLKDIHAERRYALRRLSLRTGRARRYAPLRRVPGGACRSSLSGLPRHDRREYTTMRFTYPAAKHERNGKKQDMRYKFGSDAEIETPWGAGPLPRQARRATARVKYLCSVRCCILASSGSCQPGQGTASTKDARRALQQEGRLREARAGLGRRHVCALSRSKMDCAACHTSWMTSCFGCHLPQEANWRTNMHHFEDKKLRNWASYNPQVARDDVFMLGVIAGR